MASASRPALARVEIVLGRMDTSAQHVTVMPFERIGTCQAVIAGQRQRVLDRRNRIIGDGQLDGVGFEGLSKTPLS